MGSAAGLAVLSAALLPAPALAASAPPAAATPAAAASPAYVTTAFSPTGGGWQSTAGGHVSGFGGETTYGNLDGEVLNQPIVGMASTPDGQGYWLVASDGGVFSFGDAAFYGSTGNERLAKPVVGMASTPDGQGYWLVASDGGVFSFGDAAFYGSTGNERLAEPVVGMASTPDGHGYRLVASDGGIFTFGDATFLGSTGDERLVKPVVGMASTPDGQGYWLVASDGGVFTFGDAPFYGSEGNQVLAQPVIGIAPMPGGGYSVIAADASYETFGPPVVAASSPSPTTVPSTTTTTAQPTTTTTSTTTASSTTTAPPPTTTTVPLTTTTSSSTTAPSTTTTTVPPTTTTAPSTTTTTTPAVTTTTSGPTLAVLAANGTHLATDKAAGVKMVTILLFWSAFEPQQGVFSSSYLSYVLGIANQYRAAGMSVAIDPGIQHPPSWVLGLANGTYVDQHGATAGVADFAWSQAVRNAGSAYLAKVVSSMGSVVDYRVGSSENGEAMLPGTGSNQWWAYTPSAQGSASGLPGNLTASPMPGWVPGTTTWNGQAVTVAMATNWYNWYFSGEVGATAWEINAYHNAGYWGQLELVMPGMGSLPTFYNERLDNLLADGKTIGQNYDDYYTLNQGAVWWKLLDSLPVMTNLAVDVSSVDDGSGSPQANGCSASDSSVAYASSAIWSWSDTRWLAYLANAHHLPLLGENPGDTPASALPAIMNLVRSCNMSTLQWAWDNNLYANDGSATLAQLQQAFFG
jgi:hypothetical protein